MVNQVFTGTPTSRRFALCPASIVAGQPVLLGKNIPAVALDNYQSNTGGTTFLLGGAFNLPVYGYTVYSPVTNGTLNPGHKLYADGGVDDPTTGITYNFILSGDSGGVLFGEVDPSYTTGVLSGSAPDTAAIVNIIPGAS